jgi:hypothetical protein
MNKTKIKFLDLPDDIIKMICEKLKIRDSISLSSTSTELNAIIKKQNIYKIDDKYKEFKLISVNSNFDRLQFINQEIRFDNCDIYLKLVNDKIVVKCLKFTHTVKYFKINYNLGDDVFTHDYIKMIIPIQPDHLNRDNIDFVLNVKDSLYFDEYLILSKVINNTIFSRLLIIILTKKSIIIIEKEQIENYRKFYIKEVVFHESKKHPIKNYNINVITSQKNQELKIEIDSEIFRNYIRKYKIFSSSDSFNVHF